jgi:trehalose/maltose hydrolase-like predicted phosphorylase
MTTPISPAPVTEYLPSYIPAYLSNGIVGLRVGRVPFLDGLATANGFVGIDPADHIEALNYAPFPIRGDVSVDGVWLSQAIERSEFVEQRYDFSCGELISHLRFHGERVTVEIEVVTFCSRTHPTIVAQQVRLRPQSACDVVMRAGVDQREIPGTWDERTVSTPGTAEDVVDGSMAWRSSGGLTTCGAAYVTTFSGAEDAERTREWDTEAPLRTDHRFRARSGRWYTVRQLSSLVPDVMHHQPAAHASRMSVWARGAGFDRLRAENRLAWEEIWTSRLILVGADERWQAMADAAAYYLRSSVHPSSPCSTSIFGQSQWRNYHYYRGHVMWDIEMFCVPPLLLTAPEAVRGLLGYRTKRLEAARMNAAMYGRLGLQFPWESGAVFGEETTPLSAEGVVYEEHAGLSIALAFARFVHATGDEEFARQQAWPVLRGVAQWVASRVEETGRGFEIRGTTGADEQHRNIDNDAMVNMAACVVLREASALGRRCGAPVPDRWLEIAAGMRIPMDAAGTVILTRDGYRRGAGAAPGPPAGIFPYGYEVDRAVEEATIRTYLEMAEHYVGAPMLSALLGAWAAMIGDRGRAQDLFEQGYADFVMPPWSETNEMGPTQEGAVRAGPFFANLGGFLMSCLFGLTGLRLGPGSPGTWCERPVLMPAGWDGVEVERLWVRGRPVALRAKHGDERASLEP